MRRRWLTLLLAGLALTAHSRAGEVHAFGAVDSGWYDETGFHGAGSANYFAGFDVTPALHFRNFFVFDLGLLAGPVTAAVLRVDAYSYLSPDPSETYTVYDVATSIPTLMGGGFGLTTVFDDLGTGVSYGSRIMTPAEAGTGVNVPLSATAEAAIAAAAGDAFALGGALTTLSGQTGVIEGVFGGSATTRAVLMLNCPPSPMPACSTVARAKIVFDAKSNYRQKVKIQWKNVSGDTSLEAFGDPVSGDTGVSACIYDDADELITALTVARGSQLCSGRPCWSSKGTIGYVYKDKENASSGVSRLHYRRVDPDKAKAILRGMNDLSNDQYALPVGPRVGLDQLFGNAAPTVQLVTTQGLCAGATMNRINTDNGVRYGAQFR